MAGPPGPSAGLVPGATVMPEPVSVAIVNAGPAGTAVDYVVDGVTYRTEGGRQQGLAVGPTSTILYNRGGDMGTQRYALSAGVYEFRSGEAGWALYKLPPTAGGDAGRSPSVTVPKNDLPATTAAPRAGEPAVDGAGARR